MNSSSPSLAGRALLALLLMVGFYLLALALIGLLLGLAYFEVTVPGRINIRVVAFSVITALGIAWAVLPRPDKFVAPGPELKANDEPRLFSEIAAVAAATEQAMPAEVYLLADANAFVTHRGGFMGFGSKRVMGIGLPLLQAFTISEMKAVLAHEFGHFHGGDTAVGPWIYKTRAAIMRSLQTLNGGIIAKPFEWYAKMFMRLTQAVSRQQEFAADALAARAVGAQPMMSGLQKLEGVAAAFNAFWQREYVPVLQSGARPPLAHGFARFMQAEGIATAISTVNERAMSEGKSDLYDSHPATRERVAALQALAAATPSPVSDTPAITLLENVPALEQALLGQLVQGKAPLTPITWEEVGDKVLLASYERNLRDYAPALQGVTIGSLPNFLQSPLPLNNLMRQKAGRMLTNEEMQPARVGILGSAIMVALARAGWQINAPPGGNTSMRREGQEWNPFPTLQALVQGNASADVWHQEAAAFGVQDVALG